MARTKLALEKLAGVKQASVTLEPGRAVVLFDPARVKPEEMIRAIREHAGFEAALTAVEDAPDAVQPRQ